jgi:hypothetical protein
MIYPSMDHLSLEQRRMYCDKAMRRCKTELAAKVLSNEFQRVHDIYRNGQLRRKATRDVRIECLEKE